MGFVALPIGVEDFSDIIKKNYYYVDKTLMIKDLLDSGGKTTLFTRPRRFGKTLNMSMLKYFFELPYEDCHGDVTDYKYLFDGLKISEAGEKYMAEQGQYPVISLTLKSAKQPSFDSAFYQLKATIAREFYRHEYLVRDTAISSMHRDKFLRIMNEKADYDEYATALAFLSDCLFTYHKKKVVVLIDEYDVPLENAYFSGFYEKMVSFIRSLFESVLKTNINLEFAVITGCLRISRESIFTGLNNLKVMTVNNNNFSDYFGFTEKEVSILLESYDIEAVKETVKKWYDGYVFGVTEIYNPWSIMNYVDSARTKIDAFPVWAWSNSSSNSIIKDLIRKADGKTRSEIESLMLGEAIEKTLHEEITYDSIYASDDNLWSFLLATGYLKVVGKRMDEYDDTKVMLKIPNTEVLRIYRDEIINWFSDEIKAADLSKMYQAMMDADIESFQEEISLFLTKSISYYDNKEAFYHGFLLGLMTQLSDYIVNSNRESGNGRYDIAVRHSYSRKFPVIILEFKVTNAYKELAKACDNALEQIHERNYKSEFEEIGYTKFVYYGIGFCGKDLMIKAEKAE